MKTIYVYHDNIPEAEDFPPLVMALGYFDGVHRGHQEVIRTAGQIAGQKQAKLAVMTFSPHPKTVLSPDYSEETMRYITPLPVKEEEMKKLEVDYLFVVHFDQQFAELEPQEFVDFYLIGSRTIHVVAGFDFSYGRLGKGTMETLPFHARGKLDYTTVGKKEWENEKISSTLIKQCILEGNVEKASMLLGRLYAIRGLVVKGEQRGRTIGFPTANVQIEDPYIVPDTGVYAVWFTVQGRRWKGVCNIGYKPTFHDIRAERPEVEVHVFDMDESIYGAKVDVEWVRRLRGEKKFSSVENLIEQLHLDKKQAEEVLSGQPREIRTQDL